MIAAFDDPAVRQKMHQALVNFPSNGKPPRGMSTEEGVLTDWMIQIGFVSEHEQKTPRKTCGTPRVTYSYCKITPAGRFFMAAMRSQEEPPYYDPERIEAMKDNTAALDRVRREEGID